MSELGGLQPVSQNSNKRRLMSLNLSESRQQLIPSIAEQVTSNRRTFNNSIHPSDSENQHLIDPSFYEYDTLQPFDTGAGENCDVFTAC